LLFLSLSSFLDYQLLQEADSMVGKRSNNKWLPLNDGKLSIQRLQDINFVEPSSTRISGFFFFFFFS
jgi:hypothetical protein